MGQGTTKGSFKQFALFNGAVPAKMLLQMRAGLVPSPYEDNNLANYYFLDANDVSDNQEKVFNHATGSWEAIFLNIPSTTNVNKFVDPAVTTRQRYEELPSCNNEKGLYLDPVFLVCKTIDHYAYSVVGATETKLPLPELRDGGSSWTLSFWVYVTGKAGGNLIVHRDSSTNIKFEISYSAQYELVLQDSTPSVLMTVPAGYFFNGKWNIINLVCSEASLQD